MRKLLLEALRTKFEGVSEQVLGRIADKMAKTVKTAEEVTTAIEGVAIQQVIDSYGDSRANEAQQTAIKNYESKHGLKDGVKVKDGSDPTQTATENSNTGGDDTPAWARGLIEANRALNDRLNRLDVERTTENRKQQLAAIVGRLPESVRRAYERTPLESLTDDEFANLKGEISNEVNAIVADTNAKGAVFGRPVNSSNASKRTSTNVDEATNEEAKAVVDRLSI